MKKSLFLRGLLLLCLAGCGTPPIPYESWAFKDYPSTWTTTFRNGFIEQTFENFFPCEPDPRYPERDLNNLSKYVQERKDWGGSFESDYPLVSKWPHFLIYNYRYAPYDDTLSLLELLISRYKKSDDEQDIVLCGSGSYLFLLGNIGEDRGDNTSMTLLQQFSSLEQMPEGAKELLEQVPLEDTRYLQGLQYFQLAPYPFR